MECLKPKYSSIKESMVEAIIERFSDLLIWPDICLIISTSLVLLSKRFIIFLVTISE
jgi:hypothetical protein